MQTRAIGSLQVTIVGVGCNNFGRRLDEAASIDVINASLDAGINFFDTADVYGATKSEEIMGKAFASRRKDVIIATKFGNHVEGQGRGAKPEYVKLACEYSLRRLATDYIDLYQLHVPDPEVPIADTLGALNDLVKEGKVREIGCSNFSAEQLRDADSAAAKNGTARFVSVQNEYSLLQRESEREVLAECAKLGIGYLPYFPLASGLLTGKYRLGQEFPAGTRLQLGTARGEEMLTEQNLSVVEKLNAFAESHGHTLLELAMSWLASQPEISSVIAGASSRAQIQANAAAINWQLTDADFAAIDQLLAN